jgi:hypothetical protein
LGVTTSILIRISDQSTDYYRCSWYIAAPSGAAFLFPALYLLFTMLQTIEAINIEIPMIPLLNRCLGLESEAVSLMACYDYSTARWDDGQMSLGFPFQIWQVLTKHWATALDLGLGQCHLGSDDAAPDHALLFSRDAAKGVK